MGGTKAAEQSWRSDEIAQLSLLLESQDFVWDHKNPEYVSNVIAPFVSEDRTLGRLFFVGSMLSANQLKQLLTKIQRISQSSMAEVAKIEPAGYPPLYVKIIDYVVSSQIRSFFLAAGIIFVLMLLWLRSLRLALISLLSNGFPVLVMLGVMGALEISLDVATATVAAIAIGVAIDDTVHFLHHWREAENNGADWAGALESTYKKAGIAAVTTTMLLLVGFPILMLAGVKTVVAFGLLTTVAAAAALYGDLVILPLVLSLWPPKRREK
jgi:predicted RND superfamily exporter protein